MLILHSLITSAGEEYTSVSTNVTFNASTATQTVNIPILDNEIVAGSTMFSVSLTSADPNHFKLYTSSMENCVTYGMKWFRHFMHEIHQVKPLVPFVS